MSQTSKPWIRNHDNVRTVIINATVIDVERGEEVWDCGIEILNGKVVDVGPHVPATPITPSDRVIDVDTAYVLPGLIDCHVHLMAAYGSVILREDVSVDSSTRALRAAYAGREMLMRGFTTIRDCGGAPRSLSVAFEEGLAVGPRLFVCGSAISQTGGHGDFRGSSEDSYTVGECYGHCHGGIARLADGVSSCLVAARDELRRGAHFIKICGTGGGVASPNDPLHSISFTDDEVQAIAQTASRFGTYATAHAYTPNSARHAILNGVKGIEHGNLLDLDTLRLMKQMDIFLTPTLITYNAFTREPYRSRLDENFKAKNAEVLSKGLETLKAAHDMGITICYGSDLLSDMQHLQSEEFSIRAKVLPAAEVLKMATCNPAKMLGMKDRLGTLLSPGCFADLVVLSKDAPNPLEDVAGLAEGERYIDLIMKDGKVVLERREMGVRPRGMTP
ncbi:hypothetical protein IE53DRAFT_409186 [Violaceomyces palustris]|uniref:Uncharacterized protein n=1 Tax=Violaceomyces palustris TaxID=1673888 RepID=A0ACD0P410_9BASI|nr:hypothetical protein IE53DRAFT_409186 [Violaceomyces palustris]